MRPQSHSHAHGHGSDSKKVGSSSSVVTRSRSASASSSRTSSGTSSSSSSGSGSSSSSSSGSDSDSSSSDTEGSQNSRASRASRTSKGSSSKKSIPQPQSQPIQKPQHPKSTSLQSNHSKNRESNPQPPKISPDKKNEIRPQSQQPKQKALVPPTPRSQGQPTKLPNKPINNNKSNSLQAPVKPIKKPTKPSPSLTKVSSTTTSKALANFKKKNTTLGSSSESESSSAISTPVKRVGSKPVATVSIITSKQPPDGNTSQKKISVVGAKTPNVKNVTVKSKNVSSSKGNSVSSTKKSIVSHSKKSVKSTTTDNSSEESADELSKRRPKFSISAGRGNVTTVKGSPLSNPRKPDKRDPENKSKKLSPVPKPASSSSLSESGTTTTTSTSSSEDSGSESEKKSDVDKKSTNMREASPKSPSSSGRKRVITRRRTVKSKTIATTTILNPTALSVQSNSHNQNSITIWSSDDYSGGSDDQNHYSAARVPAKTSYKPRPRTTDDEDEMEMERKCPYPSCDSSGHLSGEYPTHSMLSTCPKYQGFQAEECKENADERRLREAERKKFSNILHPRKTVKLSNDAKNWVERIGDLKERESKEGVTAYDMSLWVDGLAVAARKIEDEQAAGIGYRSVVIGKFEMSCWCESPYPDTLSHSRRIFICEFCLKPAPSGTILRRHCTKCVWRHPPGDEIYRKDRISVWEVDGKTQKTYCQNLCLLAKCFLDHKTLYLDVDPFLFYVMTLADSQGCHLVGYFSKEKNSFLNYNVSCILTLPPYQRKGFGRLLIDFSYLLTRVEGKVGSPEKPLSDLGLISYRSYWKDAVLRRMCACATREMIVKDLSIELGVASADIISTLQFLGMLKYWKGKHIVLKKQDVIEEYMERVRRRGEARTIDPNCLRWRPFQPPVENST